MTAQTTDRIDIASITIAARQARAELIRSLFARLFARRPRVSAPVPSNGQAA